MKIVCLIAITTILLFYLNQSLIQESYKISNNNNRIFFHETSGRSELSFRQTCSIESAALHNPQRPIQVFIQPQWNTTINSSSIWLQVLNHYPNVQVIAIDDEEQYFKNTPLEEWYQEGKWRNSSYRVEHMSDYIRMISVKKEGGMYLDLDVITLKSYDSQLFWNFVTGNGPYSFLNAVFHLERGHRLIDEILRLQAQEYDPSDYTYNGPGAMTLAMENLCNVTLGDWSSNRCKDVRLLPNYYFYPNGNMSGRIYFMSTNKRLHKFMELIRTFSYGAHCANFVNRDMPIDISPNSTQVIVLLAAEHCPISFSKRLQFPVI